MTLLDVRRAPSPEAAPAAASGPPARRRAPLGRRVLRSGLPLVVALAALLAVWQVVVWLHVKPGYVLPSPGDVARSIGDLWGQHSLQDALLDSVRRGLTGYAAAVVLGTALGLVVARVRLLRLAVRPLLAGMLTLPSVAWVPAAILWFGLSSATVYSVVLLGSVPAIANSLITAVDGVPPLLLRAGRVLGARRLTTLRHVVLPAALPGYLVGLRQGWAFSWHALMTAEVIAVSPKIGPGLGQLLDQGRELSDISQVFAAIVAILAVGVAVDRLLLDPVERAVLTRRGLG